jgi:integrase
MRTRTGDGDDALFVTTAGKRLAEATVGVILRSIGERAGVKGLRAHIFRHTWTQWQLAGQMQEHDVMALGGWNSTQQLGRYGAAMAAQRARAAGKQKPVLKLIRS